ncbi:Major facilitator superfamily domain, general substrate transporter, partial [Metarhizium majus ARSEF 297]
MDQPKVIDDEKQPYVSHDIFVAGNSTPSLSSYSSHTSSRTAYDAHSHHANGQHDSTTGLNFDFDPPDGGWRAWSQVLAANLANAVSWGYAATFGVYQLYYVDAMGLESSQVSWIGSVQVFLAFIVCGPSGRIADAGYAHEIIIVGCFFVVLGSYMTSFCYGYWQIMLAQGVCTGIGLGVISTPAVAITSSYFSTRRSLALSMSAMGTSAGGVVFPAIVQYLIPQVGFSWATRVGALVALILCIGACVLLKPYIPGRKTGPWVEWAAFKEIPYALFAAAAFLNFYGMYFGLFYINSFARNVIGFSSVESVSLLLITNSIGLPVRPIIGYLANTHVGPINVFIMATAFVGVMLFIWTTITTRASMYVFSVFYGLAVSANQSTYVPSLASLTQDPQKMGIRFGMIETLCAFSTLAGPPTAGAIIDRTGSYALAQIWGGSVMLAAALTLAASRVSITGWKWKVLI